MRFRKAAELIMAAKVADALNVNGVSGVRFAAGAGGTINFKADNASQNAVICVVEVKK